MARSFRLIRGAVAGILVGGLALSASGAGRPTALKDPFEGTWKITATADGTGKDFKDSLTFKGNTMTAATLKTKGWEPGEYDGDYRGIQIATFTATLKKKTGSDEMKWTGTLAAGEIKGTITIKADGKDDEKYTYSGSRH